MNDRMTRERAEEYEIYNYEVGIKPDTEFVTVSYWETLEAMSRFAGADPRRIHHLPRDHEFLVELPKGVQILKVRWTHGNTGGGD
jgi:heme-degrading monooxygenase HmoA